MRAEALEFFAAHQLYPFSIKASLRALSRGPVKENVYAPDWRTPERLHYTSETRRHPRGMAPREVGWQHQHRAVFFQALDTDAADVNALAENLAATVAYLAAVREDTGREIHSGWSRSRIAT